MLFSPIEQSILATLIYHDCLGVALSSFDLWKYGVRIDDRRLSYGLREIHEALHGAALSSLLTESDGFWCFRGREELFKESARRRVESGMKRRALSRISGVFRCIPFIEGVVVSGSVAYGHARKESDLDVLIVARRGYVWTVRLLCSFVLQVLGKRRHGSLVADRVCLNHFIDNQALAISLEGMYNAQTYARWLPQYRPVCYTRLLRANVRWIERYLLFFPVVATYNRWSRERWERPMWFVRMIERSIPPFVGCALERACERIQRSYIRLHRRSAVGGRIVLSDSTLEFHPNSLEPLVIRRCNARFREFGLQFSWKDSGLCK